MAIQLTAIYIIFQMIVMDKFQESAERILRTVVPFENRKQFSVSLDMHGSSQLSGRQIEYYPFVVGVPEHFLAQRADVLLSEFDKPVLYRDIDTSCRIRIFISVKSRVFFFSHLC